MPRSDYRPLNSAVSPTATHPRRSLHCTQMSCKLNQ